MDQENNKQSTYSQYQLTKQQNISFAMLHNNAYRRVYKLQRIRILLVITICLLLFPRQTSSYRINNLQDQLKIAYFENIIDNIKTILTINNSTLPNQQQDNNKNVLKQNNPNFHKQSTNNSNSETNTTKIQKQVQKYSNKFHSFIYPYNIYDVRYLKVKKLRQLIPQIGQSIHANLNKKQTNKTASSQQTDHKNQTQTTNTTDDYLQQKFNQTIVAKQLFLFLKIDQCINVDICKYFDMIPNNIILFANSNNQIMNLYKVSQNQFVVQSIVNQNNNSAEAQKQQQGYSNNRVGSIVDLYNININNFIYFKINQPTPYAFLLLQKLLIKSQVFRNMHNNQYWDVANNGSSLRFVRLIKRQITTNSSKQSNITQILQNKDKDNRIQQKISKRIKKIPQRYKNTAQQLQKIKNKTVQQLVITKDPSNSISYINTLQILQFSINLHQQNRQYITKFYSHQYTTPQLYNNNKKQLTYRRNMIGNSYTNNFYIFITTPINRSQRVIRIFGSSLRQLLLISQLNTNVYNNDNTFLQKMSRQNRRDILVYYNKIIKQHSGSVNNSNLITLGQLIFRQLDSKNMKVNNYQCKYNISYILHNNIEQQHQPKISKISNQFISICINTSRQLYCQIIHISCKLVYNYTISQNIIANKIIKWNYISQQLQYFNHIIEVILYYQFNQTQELYLTIRIAISQQGLSTNIQLQIKEIFNNQGNIKYIDIVENNISINTTISDQVQSYYSYSSNNDQSLNSTFYTEIHMNKLSQIQQALYFNQTVYTDRQKYRYMIGTMMMQKKLTILLKNIWHENVAQQEDNCQLLYKDDNKNNSQLIGIGFGNLINKKSSSTQKVNQTQQTSNPVWRICRISLQSYHQNLVIQPQYQSIITHNKALQHPYTIYRCSFLNSSTTSKCLYAEWQANKRLLLPQNAKTILFIINHGQTYNLKISDLNTIQMDKIAQSFLIMFLSLSIITCLFTCIIVCRPLCIIGCMYLGWSNSINQGNFNFRYPLNCFEVMLKMRKMMAQRIIKQVNYKKSKHHSSQIALQQQIEDDCVFCLQPKLAGLQIIQVYCKHSYHKQCFEEWVKQQGGQLNCPMCKRKINLQGYMQYQNVHDNMRQEEIEM